MAALGTLRRDERVLVDKGLRGEDGRRVEVLNVVVVAVSVAIAVSVAVNNTKSSCLGGSLRSLGLISVGEQLDAPRPSELSG